MRYWHTDLIQNGTKTESAGGEAVIVLNGSHDEDVTNFLARWSAASLKVAVDGGTNFVFDKLGTDESLWPDIITGDLDSVRQEVKSFYKEKNIPVHHTEDQNFTDFTKCLRIVANSCRDGNRDISRILVFGAYGGRLDHVFGNVNSLLEATKVTDLPVCLLDDRQQTFLLTAGDHQIQVDQPDAVDWCALVPVAGAVTTTTTGLKWNLGNDEMAFGGIISTSNKVISKLVTVKCDGILLWMMGR